MSENGPREGTRDLPRPPRESGFRNMDDSTAAGRAYRNLSQHARRRQADLQELLLRGVAPERVPREYAREHPIEAPVSAGEVERARAALLASFAHKPTPGPR